MGWTTRPRDRDHSLLVTRYVAVLPVVHQPWGDACIKTCRLDNLLVVNNTVTNLGVMRSHNMGIDYMKEKEADWLIVISAAIRFGDEGGLDFARALDRYDGMVLEAAGVFGWHLIAFRREVFELAGRWDENFTPYGFDDLDLSWRIQIALSLRYETGKELWTKFPVDVYDEGMGHSIKLANVEAPAAPRLAYLMEKWGVIIMGDGGKGPFRYTHPFDDETKDVRWWPDAPNGGRWND